jgi:hypothetical protein
MLFGLDVSRPGQPRYGKTRRRRFPAPGLEGLEARTLLSTSVISTVAGDDSFGYSGDGGPATAAELNDPTGVALDSSGLFLADSANNRIREVVGFLTPSTSDISTVAGDGTPGYKGDGGPATKAELDDPTGVALDSVGDIFIADSDNDVIREVVESSTASTALGVPIGDIVTVAGDGTSGDHGDGGPATKAELYNPTGVALDASGDILIADEGNDVIREVVESSTAATALGVSTGQITTVAGDGYPGYAGDGGPATKASLLSPTGVAEYEGLLFIADTANNRIRAVVPVPDATAIAVTTSVNPSAFGSSITFTATVTDTTNPGTTPTGGTVTFDFAGFNGTVNLVSGQAGVIYTDTPPGTYPVQASYSGSTGFGPSTSTSFKQTIFADGPTETVTVSPRSAVFGQLVTVTATVTGPGGTPTGTVTFLDGGTALGTLALNGSGDATLTTSSLVIGAHSITFNYSGDTDLSSATSPFATVSIVKDGVKLVPMATLKRRPSLLDLVVEVEPLAPGGGVPTGTVTLELPHGKKDKTIGMATLSDGKATLMVKQPSRVRNKKVPLLYGGDADFEASAVVVVLEF